MVIEPETPPSDMTLKGTFQHQNYALAKATLSILSTHQKIDTQRYLSGLSQATLFGRYTKQTIHNQDLVIDGAHNPSAIKSLCTSLMQDHPNQRFPFVISIINVTSPTGDNEVIIFKFSNICYDRILF